MIKTVELPGCSNSQKVGLERVNYFPRQLLTVDDMVTECEYFRQKLRRHNRFLHGWGVVCGLEVTPHPDKDLPWQVQVGSGYALGPYGDEIFVGEPVLLDLAKCGHDALTNPCEPDIVSGVTGVAGTVYVAIRYAECFADPVRAMPAGCACDEEDCEYSRIRDSFQLSCLADPPPPSDVPSLCDAIKTGLLSCPPCPTQPWVVLARVDLPAPTEVIVNIHNEVRPLVFSTAVLQRRLIECCCDPKDLPHDLLKVNHVRIQSHATGIGTFGTLFEMTDPTDTTISVSSGRLPSAILVEFGPANLKPESVNEKTFLVSLDDGTPVAGTIDNPTPNSARFVSSSVLVPGRYKVTLLSGNDKIRSTDGHALDGEPVKLPSGDGKDGGNFSFGFMVT